MPVRVCTYDCICVHVYQYVRVRDYNSQLYRMSDQIK